MSNPGVKEMLALLDALKSAVQNFAAREAELNGNFRAQSAAATRLSDEAAVKRTARLADAVDRENAAYEERKNRLPGNYASRKARINKVHAAVRKRLLDEIGEHHGQLRHRIQASSLEAERLRDETLAQNGRDPGKFPASHGGKHRRPGRTGADPRTAFSAAANSGGYILPSHKWPDPFGAR